MAHLTDKRITESSGLACSLKWPHYGYTFNDEGKAPNLFTIDLRTGNTVGTTTLRGAKLRDPEAVAVGPDGNLTLADIGDNDGKRRDCALYTLAEPGPGNHTVTARRAPIRYPDAKAHNAETLLIHPATGVRHIITKEARGRLYYVNRDGKTTDLNHPMPELISDGTWTRSGAHILLLMKHKPGRIVVLNHRFNYVGQIEIARLKQAEGIAADPDGSHVWVTSEGKRAPIVRVALPEQFR